MKGEMVTFRHVCRRRVLKEPKRLTFSHLYFEKKFCSPRIVVLKSFRRVLRGRRISASSTTRRLLIGNGLVEAGFVATLENRLSCNLRK